MSSYYDLAVLADSPVSAYWLADPSGTTAADAGDSNPGTYSGGFTLGGAAPFPGMSGSTAFNGSTGKVSVTNAANIDFTGDMTIECWFKTSTTSVQILCGRWLASSPFSGYGLSINADSAHSGQVAAYFGGAWLYSGSSQADGLWHHVAAVLTFSGGSVTIYVDGKALATGTQSVNLTSSNDFKIAVSPQTGTQFFNGSIAAVALYGSALNSTQVAAHTWASVGALSLGTLAKPAAPALQSAWSSGLLAAYNLGEGSSTAADISGNAHTGTLTGGCTWSSGAYGTDLALADDGATGAYLALGSLAALSGVAAFTFSALAYLDTYADSPDAGNDRFLIGTSRASGGIQAGIFYHAGSQSIRFRARYSNFADLVAAAPPLNQWVLFTGRITSGGEMSLWYDAVKVAVQTISFSYASDVTPVGAIGDSYASQAGNNWSGHVAMGLFATRGYSDAEIAALAADPFAWDRPPYAYPAAGLGSGVVNSRRVVSASPPFGSRRPGGWGGDNN